MSVQAMSRVWSESMAGGSERLVLLAVANYARADGSGAWPSVATLAADCRLSVRSVQRIIRRLEEIGELRVHRGAGPGGAHLYDVLPASATPQTRGRQSVTPPDILTGVNLSEGVTQLCHQGGDTGVTQSVTDPLLQATATAGDARATVVVDDTTEVERRVAGYVQQVPGVDGVPTTEIVAHLREALSVRSAPIPDDRLLAEGLKFRDYWREQRAGRPTGDRWTGWRRALTNWISRIPAEEAPVSRVAQTRAMLPARGRMAPDYAGVRAVADVMRAREAREREQR